MARFNSLSTILLLVFTLTLAACNEPYSEVANPLEEQVGDCSIEPETGRGLFKLEGSVITHEDLSTEMQESVYKNDHEAYSRNMMMFKEYALRSHLAKKLNKLKDPKNPPSLLELIDLPKVKDEEVKKFYEQHKHQMPPGSSFSHMKDQIIEHIQSRKISPIFQKKILELEDKGVFTPLIMAPLSPDIVFNLESYPTKGDKNSKVHVVEISDYLCTHCQKAHPIVDEIFRKYKNKISFTQINFSLRPRGLSGTYARGGYCALQQGEKSFWKFHDQTFKVTSVPHDHTKGHDHAAHSEKIPDKSKEIAKEIGLNVNSFEACLSSQEAFSNVEETNRKVREKGVKSTPVFIVNNKKLVRGIQELEEAIKRSL